MKKNSGEELLNGLFPNLHYSKEVEITKDKSDDPSTKILKYLNRLEYIINRIQLDEDRIHIVKQFFYEKYLVNELPERYLEIQKKINKKASFTEEEKNKLLENVRDSQKSSLDSWLEFLTFSNYPTWFKYYILRGVLKSGNYDKSIDKITRRTSSTVEPFLELNKDVVAKIYNYLSNILDGEKRIDFNSLNDCNFQRLYVRYINEVNEKNNEGIWVKYNQNSKALTLVNSILGKNSGWCTADMNFAVTQLRIGDFYIYFTKDKNGDYSIPRIAIRMSGDSVVAEIRGVIDNQNLEKEMLPIVEEKIKDFSIGSYKKIIETFKKINEIERKNDSGEDLTNEELCLLYEVGDVIETFGYDQEVRINNIRNKRNIKEDLNKIFREVDCSSKCLFLSYLNSAEGIEFPDNFYELDLSGLKSLDTLKLKDKIKGTIVLNGVEELSNYKFPKELDGSFEMEKLNRVMNVSFPEKVTNNFTLQGLTSYSNTFFPKEVGGTFSLSEIKKIENFVVPNAKSISFRSVKELKNVVFPDVVEQSVELGSLVNIENVILPRIVKDTLDLSVITRKENLNLPFEYVGTLDLKFLKDFDGLVLPMKVKRIMVPNVNINDVLECVLNSDVDEVFAEKYYKKEDYLKLKEEHNKVKCL